MVLQTTKCLLFLAEGIRTALSVAVWGVSLQKGGASRSCYGYWVESLEDETVLLLRLRHHMQEGVVCACCRGQTGTQPPSPLRDYAALAASEPEVIFYPNLSNGPTTSFEVTKSAGRLSAGDRLQHERSSSAERRARRELGRMG